jgi:thiosulfate/3-mercaptopyruvate sulfurtransferase
MESANGYARPELLAEPDWLWGHRDDTKVRLIDCGSPESYDRAHIPGAVRLGQGDYNQGTSRNKIWDPWLKDSQNPVHVMQPEAFSDLMERIGISGDTTVVAYDDFNGTFATRLWWVLSYYGHANARVLNGGWQRWLTESRPISFHEAVPDLGQFIARPIEPMRCRLDEVKARYAEPGVQVLNVLPKGWYLGTDNPFGNRRVGHIPGSANVPIERFFVDGNLHVLKPAPELRGVLAEAGLSSERETFVHCQAGVRTTMGVFVLSLLGWDRVRAYEASMAEWANRDDTPLDVGEDLTGHRQNAAGPIGKCP